MNIKKRKAYSDFKQCVSSIFLTVLLASCGGGGDSTADNGGVGGSGMTAAAGGGEVTGFGSVIFDDSTFATNGNTAITLDGQSVLETDLGVGMIATFEIADDVSPDFTSGTALRIDAVTALKGIVTSVTPLEVIDQTIVVTGDTVLSNIPGNDVANLTTADLVEVYGITDNNNVIRATRIEYKTPGGLVEWKLTGVASNVTATTLTIGTQLVNINGVTIDDCVGGLMNGDFVEIKASPNAGFVAGSTLNMVTKVECQLRGVPIPSNPGSSQIPAQFEGIVSGYLGAGDFDFFLSEQQVAFSGTTEFRGGTIDDLADGSRVEVEGVFDIGTMVLTATEIKFRQARVRIEAPVGLGDVTLGVSLDILGVTVFGTAATEDDDSILSAASGLPAQVEVRGFIDSNGTVFAEEIRDRGGVDNNDIRLRGPVDNLVNPNLEILGVPTNLTGALGYFDSSGNPLASVSAFFALLNSGDIVEVEDAQLNAGPSIVMDADSTVEIED